MSLSWMAWALVISILTTLAASLADRALRMAAIPRRWSWLMAMMGTVLIPTVGLYVGLRGWQASSLSQAATTPVTRLIGTLPEISNAAVASTQPSAPSLLNAAWALLSLALLTVMFVGYARIRRSVRAGVPATIAGIPVLVCDGVGPLVFGLRKPRLVVPAWIRDVPDSEKLLILRHEQEHIRSRDGWLLLGSSLLLACMPWNPLLWVQHSRLRLRVETDCDQRVLGAGGSLALYCQALLRAAGGGQGQTWFSPAWGEPSHYLRERILAMTSRNKRLGKLMALPGLALSVAIIVVACEMATQTTGEETASEPSTTASPNSLQDVPKALSDPLEQQAGAVTDVARPDQDRLEQQPGTVVDVARLDQPPRLVNQTEISDLMRRAYPRPLLDAGLSGRVEVELTVRPDGTVDPQSVKVLTSSNPQFDDATTDVVRYFRFDPGKLDGRPVATLIRLPLGWQAATSTDRAQNTPAASDLAQNDRSATDGTQNGGVVTDIARLDQPPRLVNQTEISSLMRRAYPRLLREAGVSGRVEVELTVRADGTVDPQSVKVLTSSNSQFDEATTEVVRRFRFDPGKLDGQPVQTSIRIPLGWQPETF